MGIYPKRAAALLLSLAAVTGCASERYRYIPAQAADSGQYRHVDLVYDIPGPPAPSQGTVRVFSMGVVNLRKKGETARAPALHLRIAISNGTLNDEWTLSTDEQTVTFANQGTAPPVVVNSDEISVPRIEVKPHDLRQLDLYYALPATDQSAPDMSDFAFHWTIHTGATQVVAQTALFKRVPIRQDVVLAPYPYGPYPLGWGPVWYGRAWYRG